MSQLYVVCPRSDRAVITEVISEHGLCPAPGLGGFQVEGSAGQLRALVVALASRDLFRQSGLPVFTTVNAATARAVGNLEDLLAQ